MTCRCTLIHDHICNFSVLSRRYSIGDLSVDIVDALRVTSFLFASGCVRCILIGAREPILKRTAVSSLITLAVHKLSAEHSREGIRKFSSVSVLPKTNPARIHSLLLDAAFTSVQLIDRELIHTCDCIACSTCVCARNAMSSAQEYWSHPVLTSHRVCSVCGVCVEMELS